MSKVDVYLGGYLLLECINKAQSDRLASASSVIGMPITFEYRPESEDFLARNTAGDEIGIVTPKNRLSMREALEEGWRCRGWLSLVYFDNSTSFFKGEVVYQLYNVKSSQTKELAALDSYAEKTSQRLAKGERPNVSLSGTAYETVLATGDWKSDDTVALPIDTSRSSGMIVYKRKRGLSDNLIAGILERRPSAIIAAILVPVVVIALVILVVIMIRSLLA